MGKDEKIKIDYDNGLTYDAIAIKNGVKKEHVKYLVKKYHWQRENKNKGGGRKNNKNAVKTGEFENLFSGFLYNDEKEFFLSKEEMDKKTAIINEYKILTIREKRMLERIKKLENGRNMTVKSISKTGGETTTSAENTIIMVLRIETALTRIQESKRRCLDSLHRMNIDEKNIEIKLIGIEQDEIEDLTETDGDIYGK